MSSSGRHRDIRLHFAHPGLFTRFFAAAAAIEMLFITITYWGNGFGWMRRGYEYVLLIE